MILNADLSARFFVHPAYGPLSLPMIPFVGGTYRTAPRKISLLARCFPTASFYARFWITVLKASRLAKRGLYDGAAWSDSSYRTLECLEEVGVQLEITGVEHLATPAQSILVVGNHMSTLETGVLPSIIQPIRPVTFVVKRGLVEYPVFKHVMRSRDPIAVSQTNPREDLKTMLTEGAVRLDRGVSVVVFPQGSRTTPFDPGEFNTIGVKLALRSGAPIVPLALSTGAWSVGRVISDLGKINPNQKVRFAFGPPIEVTGRGTEAHRATIDFITANLRQWELEDALPPGSLVKQ